MSRVILDDQNRETMRLLSSPVYLHGAVEQSFKGERSRRLWRVDWLNGQCCLLVLSPDEPDFTGLVGQYGFSNRTPAWESRDYGLLLAKLSRGQAWMFRLKANPVHSVKEEGEKRGKVYAHVTPEQQKQWLIKRAEGCGFSLKEEGFDLVHTQWLRFDKGGRVMVTLSTATFEGLLTVTDPQLLRESLLQGIGRAKAYGCGMMTLAKSGGAPIG